MVSKYEGFLERLRWLTDDLDDKTVDAKSAQNPNLDYKREWANCSKVAENYWYEVWLNGKTSNHV